MSGDRYAVLGNPVAHSRSPAIHAAFARQTGHDVRYDRVLCPLDGFDASLRDFAAAGGRGCNVTVPFKFDAARVALRCSARARLAGAANTLGRGDDGRDGVGSRAGADGSWWADNTDGVGLVRDIEANAGVAIGGRRVLLVGAGGAASGVLGPLLAARPAAVRVVNRTAAKAAELVDRHAAFAADHGVALDAGSLDDAGRGHALLINAASTSLSGEALPLAEDCVAAGALAVDLMYGPAAHAFLAWARAAGATPRDGLGMLVEQAAESFRLWRGVRPETAAVLAALRREVDGADAGAGPR